jgi:hypothetical protein
VVNVYMIIDPALSADGNVGIELIGSTLGAYTACCNDDPVVLAGRWACGGCETGIHTKAGHIDVCLSIEESSSGDLSYWANAWLSRDDVKVQISLP